MKVPFDLVTVSGLAYVKVWEERFYLMRMAVIPILVKFICMVAVFAFALEDNQIRSTLVMLPAYFAEGWILCHLVRLIFLDQRWPFQPTGERGIDEAVLEARTRGIMGGVISFVLIEMMVAALWAALLAIPMENAVVPGMAVRLLVIVLFVLTLWGFRFFWIFVPIALNVRPVPYMKALSGVKESFSLIGVWLICSVPAMTLMLYGTIPFIFADAETATPAAVRFAAMGGHAMLETVQSLLAVAGVAYVFKALNETKLPRP